jgi:hypothetical protein
MDVPVPVLSMRGSTEPAQKKAMTVPRSSRSLFTCNYGLHSTISKCHGHRRGNCTRQPMEARRQRGTTGRSTKDTTERPVMFASERGTYYLCIHHQFHKTHKSYYFFCLTALRCVKNQSTPSQTHTNAVSFSCFQHVSWSMVHGSRFSFGCIFFSLISSDKRCYHRGLSCGVHILGIALDMASRPPSSCPSASCMDTCGLFWELHTFHNYILHVLCPQHLRVGRSVFWIFLILLYSPKYSTCYLTVPIPDRELPLKFRGNRDNSGMPLL